MSSRSRVRLFDALRWLRWGTKVFFRGTAGLVRTARAPGARRDLVPWMRFQSAADIPWDVLAGQGVKAALFDLENTLIPPGGPFTEEGRVVVAAVRAAGLVPVVVSNCSASWVAEAVGAENIGCVAPAGKPGRDAFLRGCALAGVSPREAVYVGDQLITDVFGAQRAGLKAILVEPAHANEALSSRFQRIVAGGVIRLTKAG